MAVTSAVGKVLLVVTTALAVARAAAALLHAGLDVPDPLAVYFTEPQSVHLSRRVQLGESLYPEWRSYPYVVNVFTPAYFWGVGLLGRAVDASLDELQRIGRLTTIAFWTFGAGVAAWAVRRRGRAAMVVAAGFALSAGVTMGFGWMVRPDLAADALGFAGFLAATSSAPAWLAVVALTGGILCKQTAVVSLAAAALALAWHGRVRRGAVVVAATVVVTTFILGISWWTAERRLFADVLLEGTTPWRWDHWRAVLDRFAWRAGDVPTVCLIGAAFWLRDLRSNDPDVRTNARRWLTLFAIVLTAGLVGSAKHGSDLNYFLPLRYVAAIALAELVGRMGRRPTLPAVLASVVAVAAFGWWSQRWAGALRGHPAFNEARRYSIEIGRREIDILERRAWSERILTNSDVLALRIDNPFVDAFLFKSLVETGRLQPTELVERIRRGEYDLVATTASVNDPNYLASAFGMPPSVAAAILERYEKSGEGRLTYYRPKTRAEGEGRANP
jgi:MFS family permease